jgi:uncharacterized protein
MGAAENKKLLQHIFEELAKGNSEPLVAGMADDFRWTIAGNSQWSRTHEGKQAVLTELFGPLRARISGNIKVMARRFVAEGDFVVVEARGNNTTRKGIPYNNSYCFVFRLENSRLKEVTEYMDTDLANTALAGEPV